MLEALANRIGSIDINSIVSLVIDEKRYFILDLIRSQLIEGERGDGTPIGIYSDSDISRRYVDLKFDMGLFQGNSYPNYDLFFEGTFYKSLVLTIQGDHIQIDSLDPKLGDIESNIFDKDISKSLELNAENLQILINEMEPLIQQKINAKFGI